MNLLNFVFIGLIFLSLGVIVFIFGKNIKRIKETSLLEYDVAKKENSQSNWFVSLLGYFFKIFKRSFVFVAEWIIKHIKNLLHLVHFWLIMLKREKKGNEELDEREAKKELLLEEEKNLNIVIHEGLGFEDDGIEANFVSKKLDSGITKKQKTAEIIVTAGQSAGAVDSNLSGIEHKKISQEQENKLKDFFSKSKSEKEQEIGNPEVVERGNEVQNQKQEEVFGEFNQFEQLEIQAEDVPKQGFFKKIFSRFTSNKQEDQPAEEDYSQSFLEKDFSDGVVKIQRTEEQIKNEDSFPKKTSALRPYKRDFDLDDEIGVDRKILEKKILQKIAKDPKNIENYRQLGELYIKMKNYQDAEDAYKYIVQVSPRDMDAKRKMEKIKLLKRIN